MITVSRCLVWPGLLAALWTSASAQEFKTWKHGVIEPKGDAGFMLMVGQRDFGAKHKLKVEIIDSPLLQSTYIDREKHAAIMLGQSPERDHEIEAIQTTIKNCAAAGIRTLKYNLSILGVPRNADAVPGRGDTVYGKWNLKEGLAENRPLTRAGRVNESEYWERIEYFLARAVPVAP